MLILRLSFSLGFLFLKSSIVTSQRTRLRQPLLEREQYTHPSPKQNTSTLEITPLPHHSNSLFDQGSNNVNDFFLRDLSTTNYPLWNDVKYHYRSRFSMFVYINPIFNKDEYSLIKKSIIKIRNRGKVINVKFLTVKPIDGKGFLHIDDDNRGCQSTIGQYHTAAKSSEGQIISLQRSARCVDEITIQHEFLHAMGLLHEHTRPDRNKFISIQWEHVNMNHRSNFEIIEDTNDLGLPYDLTSIMHYSGYTFLNQTFFKQFPTPQTIVTVDPKKSIRDRNTVSFFDLLKLRLLYQCISGPRQWNEYKKSRCTSMCKCWKNAKGCGKDHNLCQGSLICSNNKCVKNTSNFGMDKLKEHALVKYKHHFRRYNRVNGLVFDIEAKWKNISIRNLFVSLLSEAAEASASYNIEIYTKEGTYVEGDDGNEWTKIGHVPVKSLKYINRHEPRVLPLFSPQFIKKKTKRAIYITIDDPSVADFYAVPGEGFNSQPWLSDGRIEIKEGCIFNHKFERASRCNGNSFNLVGGVDYIQL